MKTNNITRRNFIQKTAVTSGLATLVPIGMTGQVFSGKPDNERLPREAWIAGVSQMGLHAETPDLMVDQILDILQEFELKTHEELTADAEILQVKSRK
jgi:hypothetical protein